MTTYVFPGQGSQKIGMGEGLFSAFPECVEQANAVLGYDLPRLCLEDPGAQLNHTQYTQPALYVVNALHALKKKQESAQEPDYVAGHSLGEYNALLAAGVFDFETGLKLVQRRGLLMSQATGGAMLAIVGFDETTVQSVLASSGLSAEVTLANYNSHTQFVLSGASKAIEEAKQSFEAANAPMVIALKVSGAFHSPLMASAAEEFGAFIQTFSFKNPRIPVIANITGLPYENGSSVATCLTQQMIQSVRWTASVDYLQALGETEYVEVGPGSVLTGLIRRIRRGQ